MRSAFTRLLEVANMVKGASEISPSSVRPAVDTPAMADKKKRMRNSGRYPNAKILLTPKVGEIDNKAYAQAPYVNQLNFDKINQARESRGNLLRIPEQTNLLKNTYGSRGATIHGGSVRFAPILRSDEAAVVNAKNLYVPEKFNDPYFTRANGYDKDFSASNMSGLSHELNHANNWPTTQERESIRKYQTAHPGFSNDVYNYKPSEGIQAISSLKRAEAERAEKQGLPPSEINTPGQLEGALGRLVSVDPYTPASAGLNGEEKRLRNQMRSSIEDYNRRNKLQINYTQATRPDLYTKKPMVEVERKERTKAGIPPVQLDDYGKGLPAEPMRPKQYGMKETRIGLNNPILPTTSTPYQPGTWAGHPVVRNIARTYGKTAPDIVKDERGSKPVAQQPAQTPQQPPVQAQPQAPQPPVPPAPAIAKQARVASTLNSSYNSLMISNRLTKIAATLRKATDGLKLSDRPAGKRIQPPRVMSTPTSAELIQQKRESEGDMQAKQASRKAMSAPFPD
ncbi:hypothetical protein J5W71_02700 [Akkermansia muciniphila]|jgi:hypothetical protein|uniref:hypothetical protein n=1 Tax=Akkermansia muciniphila TaxID=239935 RepID=UPI001C062C8D|nr:hypothetical protein [Akkermansia muciniphila]QWO98888.1 hypothetical protein J5W71_02700 [Akkermansia muciniphila]